MAEHPAQDRDIVTLFTKALRALGKAGHVDEAMRLGGQAWWTLDATDPRAAERVNGTMHYLARLSEGASPAEAARSQDARGAERAVEPSGGTGAPDAAAPTA